MEGGYARRLGLAKSGLAKSGLTMSGTPNAVMATAGEGRFAPRRNSQVPALIYFDGTVTSVPCLIKDMSTTGARIELREGWDNPFKSSASEMDRVKLVIRMDRIMYDCKVVRRGETELGVKFIAAPKPITKVVR
jgi:hypothetical protein